MANASEHFRQSDVTRWGMVALVCGAFAVLSANLSALVPPSMLAGLHKTRLGGASLEQMRTEVAELSAETMRLRRENSTLMTRFALQEQADKQMVQRVGALEVSVPHLLEALPVGAEIDRGAVTASVSESREPLQPAEGGSVRIRQSPLAAPQPLAADQPLPTPLAGPAAAAEGEARFGVALGGRVAAAEAPATWRELETKVGPLLLGLKPLLAAGASEAEGRIIAGPIAEMEQANALCGRLQQVSIACAPVPYTGAPL